jgi:hypothetical protein
MLSWFDHQLFVTGLPCMGVFEHLALIGAGLKSRALDESRPQRNRSQPGADRYHGSQDRNLCGDDEWLTPSPAVRPRSWTDDSGQRAFFL